MTTMIRMMILWSPIRLRAVRALPSPLRLLRLGLGTHPCDRSSTCGLEPKLYFSRVQGTLYVAGGHLRRTQTRSLPSSTRVLPCSCCRIFELAVPTAPVVWERSEGTLQLCEWDRCLKLSRCNNSRTLDMATMATKSYCQVWKEWPVYLDRVLLQN